MRHATALALHIVRHGQHVMYGGLYGVAACSGARPKNVSFDACCAAGYRLGNVSDKWPTCPTCLVLLDAALERLPDPFEVVHRKAGK